MANQDLTTLTNLATITTDDIIYVVDDPATAKNPRKATITALINVIQANTASTDLTDTTVIARSSNKLDFFAATTSAELKTVIFDETGSGALVFATSPTFVTPALGTPASGVATNLTGTSGITGLGVLTQDIDMDGKDIILDVAGNISFDNSIANITTLKNISNFPNFSLFRDQIIGDGSTAGTIRFRSKDDSSDNRIFGEIKTKVEDTTVAGNFVHGSLYIRVMDANVETIYMNFNDAKSGQIDILKNLNLNGNNFDNIQNLIHDQSVSGTDIDFLEDEVQTISIAANTTFTTANRATGKSKTLKIVTDGTLRTLDFPAWKFIGTKPTDQAASKTGVLTVTCFGTADTDIVAAYAVEA